MVWPDVLSCSRSLSEFPSIGFWEEQMLPHRTMSAIDRHIFITLSNMLWDLSSRYFFLIPLSTESKRLLEQSIGCLSGIRSGVLGSVSTRLFFDVINPKTLSLSWHVEIRHSGVRFHCTPGPVFQVVTESDRPFWHVQWNISLGKTAFARYDL